MAMQVMSTEQVLDHHLTALGRGDLDGVLDDYGDDSVLILPDATLVGREAIRGAFEGMLVDLFEPGTYDFQLDVRRVHGEVAYILWHARCRSADLVYATDTFVVRDGKIAIQTYAAKVEPR
jgi:ketosteroid isomerase-like protein